MNCAAPLSNPVYFAWYRRFSGFSGVRFDHKFFWNSPFFAVRFGEIARKKRTPGRCPFWHRGVRFRILPYIAHVRRNPGGRFRRRDGADVDRYAVRARVPRQPRDAPVEDVRRAASGVDVRLQPRPQCRFRQRQRVQPEPHVPQIQPRPQRIHHRRVVHHPAENHVLVRRAVQKSVQQVADVIHHHRLGFVRHRKRVRVPAPVAVQHHRGRDHPFQRLAHRAFPGAHGAVDEE